MIAVEIAIEQLPHARDLALPTYATAGSAGLDLQAAIRPNSPLTLRPLQRALIPTGLRLALPAGVEAQVRPRSGLAIRHGITVLNSPGTINSDYRGEIGVILVNLGEADWSVHRGDRIAQLVVAPTLRTTWIPSVVPPLGTNSRRKWFRLDRPHGSRGGRPLMLRPTKKAALAVEAVLDIACHLGPDPVQSMDIAGRLDLPRRYLEQVMQQLVRAGILKGVRGPRGGYRLAKEQRRISVGDILRIVAGDGDADEQAGASRSPLGTKVMAPLWADIDRALMVELDAISVEDLRMRAEQEGLGTPKKDVQNFAI